MVRPYLAPNADAPDPLSLRLTLEQLDGQTREQPSPTVALGEELAGVDLWEKNWELLDGADREHASFQRVLKSAKGEPIVRLVKTYRLAKVPEENLRDEAYPAYHLEVSVAIHNVSQTEHTLAYQLDGPNGLPTEGAWYATKVSRSGGASGLRDMLVKWEGGGEPTMVNGPAIAEDTADKSTVEKPWQDQPLRYVGVDTQYFAAVLLPISRELVLSGQSAPHGRHRSQAIEPEQHVVPHRQQSDRAGQRRSRSSTRSACSPARRSPTCWPPTSTSSAKWCTTVMRSGRWWPVRWCWCLHVLYGAVRNYGLAIIMLTVLVRMCMFPMSRKQAMSVQKMQHLQPEIKKIQEKYKNDVAGPPPRPSRNSSASTTTTRSAAAW